jgi:hypothetical protein
MNEPEIEISFDVKTSATVRVWVDRNVWEKMSEDKRQAFLNEQADDVAANVTNRGTFELWAGTHLSVSLDGGDATPIEYAEYDPE